MPSLVSLSYIYDPSLSVLDDSANVAYALQLSLLLWFTRVL